jgi:hypothetical protein
MWCGSSSGTRLRTTDRVSALPIISILCISRPPTCAMVGRSSGASAPSRRPVSGAPVDSGRESATGADKGLLSVPFGAPACWWARALVPSKKCSPQSTAPRALASAWRVAKTGSQWPACCLHRKREYTVRQGPKRSGRSRQGTPVASRQRMPLRIVRWSWAGRPVAGRCGGSTGCNRAHCPSLSSCRRLCQGYDPFANTTQI